MESEANNFYGGHLRVYIWADKACVWQQRAKTKGSLVLPGLAACKTPCLECHASLAPDIWEVKFQGDSHYCSNFKVQNWKSRTGGNELPLLPYNLPVSPWVRVWPKHSWCFQTARGCSHSSVQVGFSESQRGWAGVEEGKLSYFRDGGGKQEPQIGGLSGRGWAWATCITHTIS